MAARRAVVYRVESASPGFPELSWWAADASGAAERMVVTVAGRRPVFGLAPAAGAVHIAWPGPGRLVVTASASSRGPQTHELALCVPASVDIERVVEHAQAAFDAKFAR